jgi:predicted Zn-dependent peptidase
MNLKSNFWSVGLLLLAGISLFGCQTSSKYETVPNDPLKAQIYTLPNGLKLYMSVNKDEPRIQTYIAVRAGGKNDPAETTGLAHYFEHLMFKGTEQFGTMNYEAEKPLLDQIEQLFEVYRQTTDEAERLAIYHQIDSVSYEASRYAIPNEYDKLMSAIGATGTNAYTSYDQTVYTEDIPSNQLENWAKIQADRFKNCVIRGFHTELEAVYEEKNMSLTQDVYKVYQTMLSDLYPHHPYGTQTVLGTQEQLKNPSIVNIKKFFDQWYVPNNVAICMSGDFEPDSVVAIVTRYFGDWQPADSLPQLQYEAETPITSPIESEVLGLEAENLWLGWRFPGANDPAIETLNIVTSLLYNGQAGLVDIDLNQQRRVLNANAFVVDMADYNSFVLAGYPMPGQTLEEVRQLLLDEVAKVRRGEFDESMLEAIVNEYKLNLQKSLERNSDRADLFVDAFINRKDWADEVASLDRMSRITKQDIVDFANQYLNDNNYACIYKRQAVDPAEVKISKPEITPIMTNRDTASAFLREVQNATVQEIQPRFVDFSTDLQTTKAKNDINVLYKKNETNDLFELTYLFDMGNFADRYLNLAAMYLNYIGTDSLSVDAIHSEFYRLGCDFQIYPSSRRVYVTLSGLNENMPQAMRLFEHVMAKAQPDSVAYQMLAMSILQQRANAKSNQNENFSRLRSYAIFGPAILNRTLSAEELATLDPSTLTDRLHQLNSYEHRILYYGPSEMNDVVATINANHNTPEGALKPALENEYYPWCTTTEPRVFLAPYDANNVIMNQVSCNQMHYDASIEPVRTLFNEYYGGDMNSIVFQEMRESRGLAYNAGANFAAPSILQDPYYMYVFITSQADKLKDATVAFKEILDDMPLSDNAFALAKAGLLSKLRTERTIHSAVLWSYIQAQDLGLNEDLRSKIYDEVQGMSLQDIVNFHKQYVKGQDYYYIVLGDPARIDLEALKQLGPVTTLTTEEIFGY